MDRLPYEMLSLILAQLSQEDLINLPFWVTNRGLSEKEISARSSTIHVWLDERSLNTLSRVARHPVFSLSIQRIRFHPDDLASVGLRRFRHYTSGKHCKDPRCVACYKADQHLVIFPGDEGTTLSGCKDFIQEPDRATKRYLRYRTLYDAQESMKKQNKDYILLIKALRRFRSLPAVIIDFHYGFSSRTRWPVLLGDAWVRLCEPLHPRQAGCRLFKVLTRALSRCNLSPSEFGFDNTATPTSPPYPEQTKFLPDIQRQLMVEHDRYLRKCTIRSQRLPGMFSNLRKFVLRSLWRLSADAPGDGMPPYYSNLWEDSQLWWRQYEEYMPYQGQHKINPTLGIILDQCEMLEDLEISFVDKAHGKGRLKEMPYLPLGSFLNPRDPQRRPPLRNLKISNFRINERELVNFLLRYSGTLRTVHFKNLLLTSGSRDTVFGLVDDHMKLTSGSLHGLHLASPLNDIDEYYTYWEYTNDRNISRLEYNV